MACGCTRCHPHIHGPPRPPPPAPNPFPASQHQAPPACDPGKAISAAFCSSTTTTTTTGTGTSAIARLPREVLIAIFRLLCTATVYARIPLAPVPGVKTLAVCARVCRSWSALAVPLLRQTHLASLVVPRIQTGALAHAARSLSPEWAQICMVALACLHRPEWSMGAPKLFFVDLPRVQALLADLRLSQTHGVGDRPPQGRPSQTLLDRAHPLLMTDADAESPTPPDAPLLDLPGGGLRQDHGHGRHSHRTTDDHQQRQQQQQDRRQQDRQCQPCTSSPRPWLAKRKMSSQQAAGQDQYLLDYVENSDRATEQNALVHDQHKQGQDAAVKRLRPSCSTDMDADDPYWACCLSPNPHVYENPFTGIETLPTLSTRLSTLLQQDSLSSLDSNDEPHIVRAFGELHPNPADPAWSSILSCSMDLVDTFIELATGQEPSLPAASSDEDDDTPLVQQRPDELFHRSAREASRNLLSSVLSNTLNAEEYCRFTRPPLATQNGLDRLCAIRAPRFAAAHDIGNSAALTAAPCLPSFPRARVPSTSPSRSRALPPRTRGNGPTSAGSVAAASARATASPSPSRGPSLASPSLSPVQTVSDPLSSTAAAVRWAPIAPGSGSALDAPVMAMTTMDAPVASASLGWSSPAASAVLSPTSSLIHSLHHAYSHSNSHSSPDRQSHSSSHTTHVDLDRPTSTVNDSHPAVSHSAEAQESVIPQPSTTPLPHPNSNPNPNSHSHSISGAPHSAAIPPANSASLETSVQVMEPQDLVFEGKLAPHQYHVPMMLRYSERMDLGSYLLYINLDDNRGGVLLRAKPLGTVSETSPHGSGRIILWDERSYGCCARCSKRLARVQYCTRHCQKLDWEAGHRAVCRSLGLYAASDAGNGDPVEVVDDDPAAAGHVAA
ncbi:hypothetical protein BC831DRAFT_466366 [Entophlyctis helioformis]|nr:hypothetical protein BC831DRAFT_466366 [Entophlyctis helioformis]